MTFTGILVSILVNFVPIFLGIVFHEVAHGYAAKWCGDRTAQISGRLSLNPLRHIDFMGSILLPTILFLAKTGFLFGWAKPVPINYNNFKHPKRDLLIVASAGVITNFALAIIAAILLQLAIHIPHSATMSIIMLFLINTVIFNIILAVFNLLPIPPLDGSKILFGWSDNVRVQKFLNADRQGTFVIILLIFAIPMLFRSLGYDFNPFGWYMVKATKFFSSFLLF